LHLGISDFQVFKFEFCQIKLGRLTDKPAVNSKHSLKFDFSKSLLFMALYVRKFTLKSLKYYAINFFCGE